MFTKLKKKTKSLSHFIWLLLLIVITVSVTYFNETNKKSQYSNLKKTLSNLYFQKTVEKITSELLDRYNKYEFIVKDGDNYENIINKIEILKEEKIIFLETIKKIKILKY